MTVEPNYKEKHHLTEMFGLDIRDIERLDVEISDVWEREDYKLIDMIEHASNIARNNRELRYLMFRLGELSAIAYFDGAVFKTFGALMDNLYSKFMPPGIAIKWKSIRFETEGEK